MDGPTRLSGHTLDLVLTPVDCDRMHAVRIHDVDEKLFDHSLVTFEYSAPKPPSYIKTITFRKVNCLNEDLISSEIGRRLEDLDL